MITKLVQILFMSQLSGHKNLKSLDSYAVASKKQQKHMSHLLSGAPVLRDLMKTDPFPLSGGSIQPGLNISGNNTVNIYFHQASSHSQSVSCTISPPRKRRRAMIAEYSDDELPI